MRVRCIFKLKRCCFFQLLRIRYAHRNIVFYSISFGTYLKMCILVIKKLHLIKCKQCNLNFNGNNLFKAHPCMRICVCTYIALYSHTIGMKICFYGNKCAVSKIYTYKCSAHCMHVCDGYAIHVYSSQNRQHHIIAIITILFR